MSNKTKKKKIMAISGSTRERSTNLNLIHAVAELASNIFDVTIFAGLMDIPPFNPDNDNENAGDEVANLRQQLRNADGVLICTPEYAMGVPGTLKNAIDWTVSSAEFSHKPTALITASSVGEKGHASLLETLRVIEVNITDETQLLISHAKLKVNNDYKITDLKTLAEVEMLIQAFENVIQTNSRTG
ncbi:MAG: NADPH-dependent FMN reductase [Acidobacteriota bacterium]